MKVLSNGGILVIDEIETQMHPLTTLEFINLFLSPNSNSLHAQILFSTHDTHLLSYSKLRRDQIYFTDKNSWESTEVFSLSDFVYLKSQHKSDKERSEADKEKRYLEGRYGAIPVFANFSLPFQP